MTLNDRITAKVKAVLGETVLAQIMAQSQLDEASAQLAEARKKIEELMPPPDPGASE